MSADLLALLARAHPHAAQGDLLAMLDAIPDRAGKKPVHARVGSRPITTCFRALKQWRKAVEEDLRK
jgi:hypothetical protein